MTRYVPERAYDGLNLYALPTRGEARLVDMRGRVVHVWASNVGQPDPAEGLLPFFGGWQHVALGADGSLYALVSRSTLLKLDPASRVVWQSRLRLHHDLYLDKDGSIHTITDELRVVTCSGRRRLVLDNELVRLDSSGTPRERLSVFDLLSSDLTLARRLDEKIQRAYAALDREGVRGALERLSRGTGTDAPEAGRLLADPRLPELERALLGEPPKDPDRGLLSLLRRLPGSPPDVLHANSATAIERSVPGVAEPGDRLVSVRNLDLLAIVDPVARRVRWTWGPDRVERPHQPSLLPDGHLLVFDNRPSQARSRVVEVVPGSGEVAWSYEGTPAQGFFTAGMGGCQALPNGNVLVVESAAGRAFEVTRSGEVVWEFFNPEQAGGKRATIYRMQRIGGGEARRLEALLAGRTWF